tara:strand:- start:2414 stop:3244 length:831 start_codon:yes stop_codon:yes gene_type:complete
MQYYKSEQKIVMKKLINFFVVILLFISPYLFSATLKIQSTTSTRDSGFYDYILPLYPKYDNLTIKVIAVGTGQAILNSKNCDGDILIVHDRAKEMKFITDGYGILRKDLMFNDFVVVGPRHDPANIHNLNSVGEAFLAIANNAKFVSRADSSGTHSAEMKIWDMVGYDPSKHSGVWYLESGQGMGPSLNIAVSTNSYILVDRSSWLKFKNKSEHMILFQNKSVLKNQYGIMLINPKRCPDMKYQESLDLYKWLISDDAKEIIKRYRIDDNQVFFTE